MAKKNKALDEKELDEKELDEVSGGYVKKPPTLEEWKESQK